jgi:hypothetical protein
MFHLHTYPSTKIEQTACSETSAYKIQKPGITQVKQENIQSKAKFWIKNTDNLLPAKRAFLTHNVINLWRIET